LKLKRDSPCRKTSQSLSDVIVGARRNNRTSSPSVGDYSSNAPDVHPGTYFAIRQSTAKSTYAFHWHAFFTLFYCHSTTPSKC